MTQTAFVFPGQGSQSIGMGKELFDHFPAARAVFEEADEALSQNLSRLMFEGDAAELMQTQNAQPAIMIVGIADTVRLLRARGNAMKEAAEKHPGTMAAVLGLPGEQLQMIVLKAAEETGGCLVIANDNCPGQLVISGTRAAVEAALSEASKAGAKRAVELPVSGAFHSPLMNGAAEKMQDILEEIPLAMPAVPVISNVTALPESDPKRIKELLVCQLTGSVLWTQSVQNLVAAGISSFVECGHGRVLSGLIRRIAPQATIASLSTPENIRAGI